MLFTDFKTFFSEIDAYLKEDNFVNKREQKKKLVSYSEIKMNTAVKKENFKVLSATLFKTKSCELLYLL